MRNPKRQWQPISPRHVPVQLLANLVANSYSLVVAERLVELQLPSPFLISRRRARFALELRKALLSIEKNLGNVATGATFRSAAKRRVPQKGLDEEGNDLITKSMHRKIAPVLSLDLPCLIFSLSPSSFLGVMSIIRSITPDFPPDLGLTFPVKTECEEGECMSAERLLSWAPMQRECILNCSSPKLCIPSIRPTLPVFSDSWTCTAHTSQVFGPALCN